MDDEMVDSMDEISAVMMVVSLVESLETQKVVGLVDAMVALMDVD
jgi:hypothetical protein